MSYIRTKDGFYVNADHITHFQIKEKTAELFVVGEIGPFVVEEDQVVHVLRLMQNTASKEAKK